jgi:hypothetical protein
METNSWAIENGRALPDGTLKPTDVLVAIDFESKVPGGPLKGGEFANSGIARRLHTLREFVGMTLGETIRAMKTRPNVPWRMSDYHYHVARGRCIVARDGKLLDHKGNVTNWEAKRGSDLPERPIAPMEIDSMSPEGKRVWRLSLQLERDAKLMRDAKELNRSKNGGVLVCEACDFSDPLTSMFDAHHPDPLAAGVRVTYAKELRILCPTCHRCAHAKAADKLSPIAVEEIRSRLGRG